MPPESVDKQETFYLSNPHLTDSQRQEARELFARARSGIPAGAVTQSWLDKQVTAMTRKHQAARRPSAAATAAPQDHIIRAGDRYPETPIPRWDANIRAIRISKQLESDKRAATPAEQNDLAKYSGFGDSEFNQGFDYYGARDPAWKKRREEIEELLTPEELEGIRTSRLNAFYTTPEVVRSMWATLSDMGADKLKNPKVLEPSVGSGRFLGMQPEAMAKRSSRMAVELDPMTADIVKNLYPETKVHSAGFQDAPVPDNHFDIAISNVPFGDLKINDKEFAATGRKYLGNSIHNYFFAKTLDKLRPGGVMAYITSHHTMDAPQAEPVRRYLADHADLVGAVRLPNDAFKDTDVVTDIVYMRKRAQGEPPGDDSWVKTGTVQVKDKWGYKTYDVPVNQYFLDNPEKVLGEHSGAGSMYGGGKDKVEYTLKSTPSKPVGKTLARENAKIAGAGSITPMSAETAKSVAAEQAMRAKAAESTKYEIVDGELRRGKKKAELSEKDTKRVRALVGIRDTARRLVEQESEETDREVVAATRESLRAAYDDYVEQYDEAINTPANRKLMGGDADDHLLFALENYDKDTECWQPSDIMQKRVVGAVPVQKASNAADAMSVVMNETGSVDFDRMGKMLDRSGAEVREELEDEGLIFRSPDGAKWIPRAEYLSGNVREKLKTAQVAAKTDKSYEKHVQALEEAQPVPIKAEDIATPLGAPWIPADVINDWVQEHLQPYTSYSNPGAREYFRYVQEGEAFIGKDANGKNKRVGSTGTGGWRLAHKIKGPDAVMKNQWGTAQMDAKDILLKTLQGAPIQVTEKDASGKRVPDQAGTIAAQEKAAAIQKSFEEWVWENPDRRESLEKLYNETHNASVPRVFDGSHQTFPGMALEWQTQMRPHQRDAIYRGVNDGTVLLAHEVGFGKTATMVATAKERKRLGLANKPVFVVPKATHEQFVGQFMELYPGAKILSPDASDFTAGKREEFLSRIATGDWDGVVLSSEQFEKIPLSPETEAKWISQQRQELLGALVGFEADSAESKRTQKQIQKRIENYTTSLEELRDRMADRSDDTITFESLGIDQIYVDEADRYKNLPYATNMGSGRGGVKGMQQSESQRAWDMYMKIRYMQEKHGQKPDGSFAKGGVVFATGTPVANTIAETWTMMRYLQPDELKRRGLESFDAWAKTYGKITSGIEQTAAGKYQPVQRFSQFVNLPELSGLFQNVADIRVASEVPEMLAAQPRLVDQKGENKRETVVSPPHPALQDYMEELVKRAEKIGTVPPEVDNMLKISSDARKASLDVRMVDPSAPHNPDGKVPTAAKNIAEIYHEEEKDKGTQLVFLDLGTPKAKETKDDAAPGDDESLTQEESDVLTNVYGTLRKELVAKGVPEDDVAFIHDYKTPAAREELFDMVRSGDVRVLVGSTEKIGVGVNVQDRAAAAHHIDVPWRPRDVEQREGRIIRQGNEVYGPVIDKETKARLSPGRGVKIFQYVQEGSFDGFMWQTVESKARAIKSLMKRQQTSRGMDDIDPFILGVAEAKALASGNPLVKRAEELKLIVASGLASHGAHKRASFDARTQKQRLELDIGQYRKWMPLMESDTEHVKNLPPKTDFKAIIEGKEYDKRTDAATALEAALKGVKYDPNPTEPEPLGDYKGFAVSGVNTDQGYQLVIAHPDTEQPYQSGYIEKDEIKAAGLMSRLDNMVKGIPDRTAQIRERLEQGEDSLKLYEEQLSKQFEGAGELDHAARQLRVIQAQLSEDQKGLREGDDPEMDVMAEYVQSADDTPREVPDADPMDLREAVEAVRSPDQADTPKEVKEALEDELQSPDNASVSPDRTSVIPDSPEVDKATAEQVERIKALGEINPGRFADRIVRAAGSMDREEAQDAIEDLVDIIRGTDNPQKIAALEALDKPKPVPQPDTMLAGPAKAEPEPVVARSAASDEVEERAVAESDPEPEESSIKSAQVIGVGPSPSKPEKKPDETPEPERETVAMATEPEPAEAEPVVARSAASDEVEEQTTKELRGENRPRENEKNLLEWDQRQTRRTLVRSASSKHGRYEVIARGIHGIVTLRYHPFGARQSEKLGSYSSGLMSERYAQAEAAAGAHMKREPEPESPEPVRETVAMATEPEPEQPEPPANDWMAEQREYNRKKAEELREKREAAEREHAEEERVAASKAAGEASKPKPTSTEMVEAAKEGPVPLTGPDSIMERLAEEKTREREETKARRATLGDVTRSAELFLAKLQADNAFQNALLNSDQQNAEIEYRQATKRAADELLAEGHMDVFRWFSDNLRFPGRLDMELRAKGVFKPAMPCEGQKVQTPDEVTALRREIRELGGSVPAGAPQEDLQVLRDDLKEGGTAGRRVQVIGSPSKPEKKPDETPEPARETVAMATEPDAPKTEDEFPQSEPTEKEVAARREELGVDDDLAANLPDIAVRYVQGTATESEQAIMENLAAGKPVPSSKAEEKQDSPEPQKAPRGADRRMEFIRQHLEHGNDVMITNHLKAIQLTPRTWQSYEETGKPFLKASDAGRLMMIEGGKYVDASSARVSAVGSDPAEKTKRKRRPAKRTDEPVAKAKSERKRKRAIEGRRKPVAIGDTLYQGHWKSGIGHLKSEMPERRDGDGDTVVAERQPRKADRYKKSPLPVPPKLSAKYARIADAASKTSKRPRRSSSRNGGTRSVERNLKSPRRAPSIKIITR